ncbi:UDP-glucose 4-epimerase GalE [Candidatus Nanosyncoccus alces]|uniref:UDP-glucose 4-epimerase n=1 Tax=Candidatus Nanosyncoccus alces TaxID=2171997 RepID=A0ABY0FPR9_9BACT|nr:UDP-glucose 4-epimerase GalE [Candidatus Nanosyncoccus alces]RYC74949.1 UDP-glucose 4-epimerase [Candidatus Nanosyncoccus alces]
MKILITGGTGYIGSHVVVELLNQDYDVEILDNLVNSKITALDQIQRIANKKPTFHQIDLLDQPSLDDLFKSTHFDLVMHFAGLKAVGESVKQPLKYYQNNVAGTINLLEAMQKHKVKNFIFSSSATVYGDPGTPEYTENLPTGQNISSPYGKTKYMIEEILKDLALSDKSFSAVALRYFNPIGNHPSGLIGEDPNGIPNNLMPYIMKVAKGELKELSIYGNDYPTADGTCRRDYIHVIDLAKGHLAAINVLKPGFRAYNLATGKPTSVLEMVKTFEKVSGKPLPHKFVARRPGDLPEYWTNPSLAKQKLNWEAKLTIEDAFRDTLAFLQHN